MLLGGGELVVQAYAGVSIQAAFTGQAATARMHQLSGGQKAVVALALLFAIQNTDAQPVYVLDEVRAARTDPSAVPCLPQLVDATAVRVCALI